MALVFSASAFAGPSRRATIRASQELSHVAYQLAEFSHDYGYRFTSREIEQIAGLADDVEIAARRNDLARAEYAVNDIVDHVIHMRQYVNNIPHYGNRLYIKKEIRKAVNRLGQEVFQQNWVTVRLYTAAPGGPSEEQVADELVKGRASGGTSFNDGEDDTGPDTDEPTGPGGGFDS